MFYGILVQLLVLCEIHTGYHDPPIGAYRWRSPSQDESFGPSGSCIPDSDVPGQIASGPAGTLHC